MTPEQEDKLNVTSLEVRRLSARVNDLINLLYTIEDNIVKRVGHQLSVQQKTDMPRVLKTGEFVVAHGQPRSKRQEVGRE